MKFWLQAFRLKTLIASVAPISVGTALIFNETGFINWFLFFCCLFSVLFLQIAANLFNDILDYKKNTDTLHRLGPERMSGQHISPKQMMRAALLFCLMAALLSIPLIFQAGLPIILIGSLSLLLAYAYTGGPFPLSHKGLGEFAVILFFGIISVMGTYYVQVLEFSTTSFIAGLQVGLIATSIMMINNMRDIEEDKKTGKETLVVKLGLKISRYKFAELFIISYGLSFYWWLYKDNFLVFLLSWLSLPLAFYLVFKIFKTEPSRVYNKFLEQSALLLFLFSTGIILGFTL